MLLTYFNGVYMKYLFLLLSFIALSCSSGEKCVKSKKDNKVIADTNKNKSNFLSLEKNKNYIFASKDFASLENCKVKIFKSVFWMNKMPIVGKKTNNTIKIMGTLSFDNSLGEDISFTQEAYLKVKSKLIKLKIENNSVKGKEIKNINFNYKVNHKINPKEILSIVFFIKTNNDNILLESEKVPIKIAY